MDLVCHLILFVSISGREAYVFLIRFCSDIDEDPETFLQYAGPEDFKTFLEWTLDKYPGVRARNSLGNYWRVLNMHILNQCRRELDDGIKRDVINI